jgi:hypothetical protein
VYIVSYDVNTLERIRFSAVAYLPDIRLHEQPLVSACDVVAQAINSLKLGKSDGNAGLSSDHFRNGCDELVGYLSLLYTASLVRGSVPAELAISTVIPIP